MKKNYFILLIFILIGAWLRIRYIGDPIWIDEVLFYNWVIGFPKQAYPVVFLFKFLNLFLDFRNPVILRLPFIIAGLLCIPLSYSLFENEKIKIIVASIFAFCPFFVFWSAMAKIYVFAWLFIILAWKWDIFFLFGAFTTPLSIIGINFYKKRSDGIIKFYIFIIISLLIIFTIRSDSGRNFLNWRFLYEAKRIWTVFFCIAILNIAEFYDRRLCKRTGESKI